MRPTKKELQEHNAFYAQDNDFESFARLLQSKWREQKQYPIGLGKLGNYLEDTFARTQKSNFLTEKIKTLVEYEVYMSQNNDKLISEPRIWNNLLSSQPLCFNLFGELHFDLKLATGLFSKLFPKRIKEVIAVKFEYSPSRGDINFTHDRSAFDVFIEYRNKENKSGFVGIEIKYAETMKDELASHKQRYEEIAKESGVFKDNSLKNLKSKPLQQIWRDHLLSIATRKLYTEGFFMFLFPSKNENCQSAVNLYLEQLNSTDEKINGFCPRHLETIITVLSKIHKSDWVGELVARYFGKL